MPQERAILAGLSGLADGILKGLEIRRQRQRDEKDAQIKERELVIKEASEQSKSDYYKQKMTEASDRTDILRQGLGLKKEQVGDQTDRSTADLLGKKSRLNDDWRRLSTEKKKLNDELSFTPKTDKYAPRIQELQNQINDYDQQLNSIKSDMDAIDGMVRKKGHGLTAPQPSKEKKLRTQKALDMLGQIEKMDNADDIIDFFDQNANVITDVNDLQAVKEAAKAKAKALQGR